MKHLFVFATLLFTILFTAPAWAEEMPAAVAAVTTAADTDSPR